MKNIYVHLLELHATCPSLVLATVTRSTGSTPQKPGSSAIFGKNGLISGTVGGGILEAKVQEISQKALMSEDSSQPAFSLNKEAPDGEDALCGGHISVLIDSNPFKYLSVYEEIKRSANDKMPGVLITMITGSEEEKVHISRYWMTENNKPAIPHQYIQKIEQGVNNILAKLDPAGFRELEISTPGEEQSSLFLLEPVFPPPSLVIAGAGHIGKALAHLGHLLDFEVTVIDDRPEFANRNNLPDADCIVVEDIGKAFQKLKTDSDTYIVIVTRGHKDDTAALKACIGYEAAYIGMIGSKNKISTMRRTFIENGWTDEQRWKKIHAPVGVDINSKTVEEIAVSIAAQLVKVKNTKG